MAKLIRYELKKIPFVFLLFSLLIILIFKVIVTVTYCHNYNKEWRQIYSKYLAYANEYNVNDAEDKLNIIREDFEEYSTEAEVIDTLQEQLSAREYCEVIQKTAQKEFGFVFNMPSDFNKLRSVYASCDLPDIINVLGYRLFVKLNEINFVPIIIILAFSSIFSIESETGMQSIIRTTGVGWDKVCRGKLALAIGINVFIFSLFYLLDLSISSAISGFGSMNSPYRSVISTVLTNDSIGTFITKYYIIGILNTVFMCCIVMLFSSLSKNNRLAYAINGLTFVTFTIISTTLDKLAKAAILITGNFMKLYNETSLIVVSNDSLIIEQYIIILLVYLIAIPCLIGALRRTS